MAWYYGTYACGHEGRTNIIGPTKNRQWIADRRFEGLCPECEKTRREKENSEKSAEAKKIAEENEYPELEGTEKQVAWALTIREKIISKMSEDIRTGACEYYLYNSDMGKDLEGKDKREYTAEIMCYLLEHTSARFWIDNRFNSDAMDYDEQYAKEKEEKEEKEFIKEVSESIVIEPTEKLHGGVAEILIRNDKVCVYYEKNEDFKSLVSGKRYRWDGSCWSRVITKFSGPIEDRASEIGNVLLVNGFAIEIARALKDPAVNGTFADEQKRWIFKRTEGKYEGWFVISWVGKSDELYSKSRSLPGSKWDSTTKKVVVPSTAFREVEDFADIEEFSFSEEATSLIEERKAIVYSTNPKEHIEEEKADKLQQMLDEDVSIPADLKEE